MNEEDVRKFVFEAVDFVESSSSGEELKKKRMKLARWLHAKYNIAIKELKVNINTGKPYLIVEYLDDSSEIKECSIDASKWENNFSD